MTLLEPWGLLAAALLPLIVLLYVLRSVHQVRVVPSVQLWEGEARQVTARARWRRPPLEVLLVLQLLFGLLGALALARPGLPGQARQNLILILDASVSMQALEAGPAVAGTPPMRFDDARRLAQGMVGQAVGAGEVALIRAAANPSILYSGSDLQAVRAALAGASPGSARSNMQAALYMAASLAAQHPQAASQTVVLSDGVYPPVDGIDGLGTAVRSVLVGTSQNNQGVTAVVARRSSVGAGVLEGFARVANYAAQPVDLPLHASADNTPLELRRVHLEPRSQVELTFSLPPDTQRFGVALDTGDVLSVDDTLETTIEAGARRNVLLVSGRSTPLAAALHAIQNVDVSIEAPSAYDPANADLVVFDNFLPPTLPATPVVVVQPPSGSPLFTTGAELADLEATRMDRTSAVLAAVDASAVRFSGAGLRDVPPWATAMLSAGEVPLVLQGQRDGHRIVVLGFDPGLSHMSQAAALPLLVANAVAWTTAPLTGVTVDPGEPVLLPVPSGASAIVVQRPDGTTSPADVLGTTAIWRDTERLGPYVARAETGSESQPVQTFDVRLPDAESIDVTPVGHPEVQARGPRPPEPGAREVWPWIVVLAGAVCATEWWYWARRG